jgi:hypothetical protein
MQITITGRAAALLVLAAALIVGGSIAYAAIPDSAGTFTGCRSNANGSLRLIDTSVATSNPQSHCTSAETQVQWGQTGPQGPPGPAGPQGPAGQQGEKGDPGPAATLDNLNVFYSSFGFEDLGSDDDGTQIALCPLNARRVGGGFSSRDVTIHSSEPIQTENGQQGWRVTGGADFALIESDAYLQAWVVCLTVD